MTEDPVDTSSRANRDTNHRTARFSVPGMDCRWRARRLAERLRGFEGVVETVLRPRSGSVVVTYDPDRVTAAEVAAAVENAGSEPARGSPRRRGDRARGGCCCRGSGAGPGGGRRGGDRR